MQNYIENTIKNSTDTINIINDLNAYNTATSEELLAHPRTKDYDIENMKNLSLIPRQLSCKNIPVTESRSIAAIFEDKISNREFEDDDPFYVADLSEIVRQYTQWKKLLPRVQPFYAIKCNPDPMVIQVLEKCGTGFDCASKAEIQLVLDAGISPERIIYANPCKQASHIRYAADRHVNLTTFDNVDELHKIKLVAPQTKLILRILTDDSKSICRFGIKFGASLAVIPLLLTTAKELKLDVIGISFHVGSGCFDASSFTDAVELARNAFDIGMELGFKFELLDIGGGFPGNLPTGLQFKDIAKVLGPTIDRLFPPHIRVIAEPGRYFVSSAFTLAVNIVARRAITRDITVDGILSTNYTLPTQNDHPSFMYYVNDGMYGSFNCITFDHAIVEPKPLYLGTTFCYGKNLDLPKFPCSIWGPTCDSIDLISKEAMLPEMKIGDWVVFSQMGAYTVAAASCLYNLTN